MKKSFWFCAVALIGGALMASSAMAWISDPQCVSDAKDDYKLCVEGCRNEFLNDKDTCHQIDPDCADGCRAEYATCLEEPLADLAFCKGDCNSTFEQTAAYCRATYKFGTWERDRCIDHAQRVGFGCRDQCRENIHGTLADCRVKFRACIRTCPLPPEEPQ